MATLTRVRSKGRQTGVATVDEKWFKSALGELKFVQQAVIRDHGGHYAGEAEAAVLWVANWLLGYASGWCDLRETLDAARRAATPLPAEMARMFLGVVAYKALQVTPKRLGEQKPKTPPHLVRCIGDQVQNYLFDDNGAQLCTVREAIEKVRCFVESRQLLAEVPSSELIEQWFTEWRAQEDARGNMVQRPRRGRPAKVKGA